ncbi:MAG: STM3941 family protein, partial [Sphingomonas sp.]
SRRFSPQMIYAIGWATIIFFGLAALFGLRMFGKRRDVLIIDEHGLTWRNWSDEHIPWDAVAKIEERDQIGQKMFCVHLHHPERHPSTTMLGRVAGLNGAMGFAAITITATGTDRSTDELRDALALHAP